ncbi:MAG: hypothetical protein KAG20_10895 [Cocleimonas sp.]|nr:hypothetical protein [Cocleimonas sp.]
MNKFLKKPLSKALGIVLASAFATGGLGVANTVNAAATLSANNLGDMAIIPYYTVRDNFITGIHITNTSDKTQVVKFRLRANTDSHDVFDINIILSPYDMWTASISGDASELRVTPSSGETTCTAPIKPTAGYFTALTSGIAEEGYVEIIGMGEVSKSGGVSGESNNIGLSTDTVDVLAEGALHAANGSPANCSVVLTNFNKANVLSNTVTRTKKTGTTLNANTEYVSTSDVLKVQYFIRDASTGMEFGDNAVHFEGFSDHAMMTNQETGLVNANYAGFDFPDLDGGGANTGTPTLTNSADSATQTGAANRNLYRDQVRRLLGSKSILNDWSYSTATNAATDWVVTVPGQYLMVNPDPKESATQCVKANVTCNGYEGSNKYTDLPITATIAVRDRDEGKPAGGAIVVSPSPAADKTIFPNEVNVVEWGGQSVFNSASPVKITDPGVASTKGWANLTLAAQTKSKKYIFNLTESNAAAIQAQTTSASTTSNISYNVPVLGFTAWQRKFSSNGDKNYGRIIHHSRVK